MNRRRQRKGGGATGVLVSPFPPLFVWEALLPLEKRKLYCYGIPVSRKFVSKALLPLSKRKIYSCGIPVSPLLLARRYCLSKKEKIAVVVSPYPL